jgi:hypothetical protein
MYELDRKYGTRDKKTQVGQWSVTDRIIQQGIIFVSELLQQ